MYKKLALTLLLVFAVSITAVASDKNEHLIFKKGLHSLQFGLSGNISDERDVSFTEKVITYKYLLSERSAIRIGFLLDNNSKDYEWETREYYENYQNSGDTTIINTEEIETKINQFTLEVFYIHYISFERKVKGYIGAGPTYSRTKIENGDTYFDPYHNYPSDESSSFSKSKGFSFVFGSEWFMNDYLSLVAEYSLSYSKISYEDNSERLEYYYNRDVYRNNTTNEKDITTQDVRISFAFYF